MKEIKQMRLKRIMTLILSLILVASLAACAAGGGTSPAPAAPRPTSPGAPTAPPAPVAPDFTMPTTPVNFSFWWWGNEARHTAVEDAVDLFTARYPNVSIEIQPATGPFAEIIEMMVTRVAGGMEADICQVNYAWVHGFGRGDNVFADLRAFSHIIDFNEWSDADLGLMTLADGQVGAVPHNMNGRILLYNKPLLAEFGYQTFPTTFEDMLSLARQISANNSVVDDGNNRYLLVHGTEIELDSMMLSLLYSMTGKEHVVGSDLQYTVADALMMYELMVAMDEAGAQPSFANHDPANNEQNRVWVTGRGGATYSWVSNPHVWAGTFMGGDNQANIGVAYFPVPAGYEDRNMQRPGLGHAISRTTSASVAPVVAYFLNEFYTDPDMIRAVGSLLGIPSAFTAYNILLNEGLIPPLQAQGLELITTRASGPMGPYWEDETLRQPRYAIQNELRAGRITPQQAAERFVNEQQSALNLIFR
jgi:oligogalacturonide transport system substrate-binding protein